jgi:hypothetical protein
MYLLVVIAVLLESDFEKTWFIMWAISVAQTVG